MIDRVNVSFNGIEIFAYGTALWGFIKHIKVSRKIKKQRRTETLTKDTLSQLKKANQLIFIGFTIAIVIRIIEIMIIT